MSIDPKKTATLVILGGVWVLMEIRHQSPPPALSQAFVAALGAVFALGGKEDKKDDDKEA